MSVAIVSVPEEPCEWTAISGQPYNPSMPQLRLLCLLYRQMDLFSWARMTLIMVYLASSVPHIRWLESKSFQKNLVSVLVTSVRYLDTPNCSMPQLLLPYLLYHPMDLFSWARMIRIMVYLAKLNSCRSSYFVGAYTHSVPSPTGLPPVGTSPGAYLASFEVLSITY